MHIKFSFLTFGDWSIIKPSSAALSGNVWTLSKDSTGFVVAGDGEGTDPFESGASTVVFMLTGAALKGGGGTLFPFKSLFT